MKHALTPSVLALAAVAMAPLHLRAAAADVAVADSTETGIATQHLEAVTIKASSRARRTAGAVNSTMIGQQELFRAACCNLGESFVTNPSVDVSYDDAATGASQIKLLGLSGKYVQMLTESLPALRGAAQPFALSYVPGTWMKSINVSKGAASVKHGYESITGQIDIDYLKTDDEPKVNVNLYTNTRLSLEANADANFHLSPRLSTNVLLHAQDRFTRHDMNADGFQDMPLVRQVNLSNRWKYRAERYIMHAGLHAIGERRTGGQTAAAATAPYTISIPTQRVEAYMKHAFIIDPSHATNIAFMANASWHSLSAEYGHEAVALRRYEVEHSNVNAQLMYETQFSERHALSTGLSLLFDHLDERLTRPVAAGPAFTPDGTEAVPGAYAQYTYTLGRTFSLMAGLRCDYDDRYDGPFATPRLHVKWSPSDYVTLRAATGLGYRSPHVMAENHNLLASGRTLVVLPDSDPSAGGRTDAHLDQEAAWNSGLSAAFSIPCGERLLRLNAEYYYTTFMQQTVVDYEHTTGQIVIHNLRDRYAQYQALGCDRPQSFSHVFQVDAQMELCPGLDVTAAYRHNVVRCTYGDVSAAALSGTPSYSLREQLLTPRFKALLSLCYQTPLKLWQIDATLSLNGSGRLPDGTCQRYAEGGFSSERAHVFSDAEGDHFRPFEQLSAQVTRRFRHVDVYVGGENLTNRTQACPIIGAASPFSSDFEPTVSYAPTDGWMLYAGLRLKY